jgi:hypothetical protein
VATAQADAQVQPGIAGLQAVLATVHCLGQLRDRDLIDMRAGGRCNPPIGVLPNLVHVGAAIAVGT